MNILLTSAGRRGYLVNYFKEVLNGTGKVHVANSMKSSAMLHGDQSVITPLIYDPNYIPFIKKYCEENCISTIIPLFDIDLPILSKHIEEFKEKGIQIIVSREEVTRVCNDKWLTYIFLRDRQIKTPKTFLTVLDAEEAVKLGTITFPLIIKPRLGMGSISIYEANNLEELRVLGNKTINNIHSSYLKYEASKAADSLIIIQEKIMGQEYGLDIINDLNGNYQTTTIKKKYAMRSGETDCAETVKEALLEELGEMLSKEIRHIANLDVDVFLFNNIPYVIEMNARFGGGYPFSHRAGVNLPKALILWLKQETVEKDILTAKVGVLSYKDIQITGDLPDT